MKTDIILAGVGGQGILSIASILGDAALHENLFLKQAETHGMSQRGGAVVSHLRISDKAIASDLIPLGSADLILSVEPMEALRYLPYLSPTGYVVTNTTPVLNIPNYPELEAVLAEITKQAQHVAIDADEIAGEIGNKRASNMVMLGAAAPFVHIHADKIEAGISRIFAKKGEAVVDLNIKAFRAGLQFALDNR
ncbi:indolepyruvate oxidoreductase subunit beta [Maribellus sediminis]|uniref:indolepyruvate oxidoreductase subunit beta n=1 Tax=Maribellus sediminis TaxID=2696285 RepID=UPI00142FD30F|nr:indolepyruvate oxidoreductase subunit beta [Maribellus sediminis]